MFEAPVRNTLAVLILAYFPVLILIALYLIPPAIGLIIGGLIGTTTGETSGMLVGAALGLGFGIWIDVSLSR